MIDRFFNGEIVVQCPSLAQMFAFRQLVIDSGKRWARDDFITEDEFSQDPKYYELVMCWDGPHTCYRYDTEINRVQYDSTDYYRDMETVDVAAIIGIDKKDEYTMIEVSRITGMSVGRIHSLKKQGYVGGYPYGACFYIPQQDVDFLLNLLHKEKVSVSIKDAGKMLHTSWHNASKMVSKGVLDTVEYLGNHRVLLSSIKEYQKKTK